MVWKSDEENKIFEMNFLFCPSANMEETGFMICCEPPGIDHNG